MIDNLATVVHYCTNEYRFLKRIVEEAKHFSKRVIVVVCDHFFDGRPENRDLLHQTYADFPECQFIEFAFSPNRIYNGLTGHSMSDPEWGFLWHSTSRYLAALYMPDDIDYALFIDSDEVIDGKRFLRWLERGEVRDYAAFRLVCYFYVHHASLRATKVSNSGILVPMKDLDLSNILNVQDRWGWFHAILGQKKILFDEGCEPFIHHYSWVRSKAECVLKSNTWGHRWDKDWQPLIEEMFRDPKTRDLLNLGIEFEEVPVYFDPMSTPEPAITNHKHVFANVLKINEPIVRRKEIEKALC